MSDIYHQLKCKCGGLLFYDPKERGEVCICDTCGKPTVVTPFDCDAMVCETITKRFLFWKRKTCLVYPVVYDKERRQQ